MGAMNYRTKRERLDSPYMTRAFYTGLGTATLLAVICVTVAIPGLTWATIALSGFFVMLFFAALKFGYQALLYINEIDYYESEGYTQGVVEANYTEQPATTNPGPTQAQGQAPEQEQPGNEIDDPDHSERAKMYDFIYGLVGRRLISENQWFNLPDNDKLGYISGRASYRNYIKLAEDAGIVSSSGQGKGRKLLIENFQTALGAFDAYVLRETGVANYWGELVANVHHATINTNSKTVSGEVSPATEAVTPPF